VAMHTALVERLELEADLGRAVERQEFELAYQPIVELDTGAVVAVEALVRWRHPDRGLLSPAEFIPAAEETGLIRAIGRQVLEQACRQGAGWQRCHRSASPLAVSVNLSVNQLHHPALVEEVASALDGAGLDPRSLILEITETALMQELERETLTRLKQLGVQIAVDDFGTGYSSLHYLRGFPIDILKIDKSFVDDIAKPDKPPLARAILDLGQSLNLRVIAEGMELEEQVIGLAELGCRWGQGYFFSRPQPAHELDALLTANGVEGWEAAPVSRRLARRVRPRANRRRLDRASL
jgi:EAL domain-containing protein (putative c-di-GMP-specific phosphodiesterase class I)